MSFLLVGLLPALPECIADFDSGKEVSRNRCGGVQGGKWQGEDGGKRKRPIVVRQVSPNHRTHHGWDSFIVREPSARRNGPAGVFMTGAGDTRSVPLLLAAPLIRCRESYPLPE